MQQRHDHLIDQFPEIFSYDPGGSQTFGYTAFDMPARITPAAGSSAPDVELEYDAFEGRAVKRATEPCAGSTCPSTTTYSTGDLYTRTVQADGPASNVEHRYRVYAGASAVAEIVRNTSGAAVATWYPHTDALGSPNVLINDSGALFRQSFAPFGQSTSEIPVGETGSLMGFTGHDHDSEAGLINMKGRLYDPVIGRFLTADPIVQSPFWSQGLNRYAYVFNSPLNLTDPSGFSAIDDYFQGLNDAPPEQAIPGYIGTGLVAGLAGYAIYEGVSLSISSGASAASATAASQSGGGDPSGAIGAGIVAMQRFSAALGPTQSTHPGVVPTRSLNAPTGGGRQSATVQNRGAGASEAPRARHRGNELGQVIVVPVPDARRGPPGAPPVFGNPYEDLAKALVRQWERSQLRQDVDAVGGALRTALEWLNVHAEQYKTPKPHVSGKEGAKDVPSWARGNRPKVGEAGKDFAKRLLDEKYGPGKWKGGPDSEFNKLRKWGDRAFQEP